MTPVLEVFLIVIIGGILFFCSWYFIRERVNRRVTRKRGIETLCLDCFRRQDRVIILKGDFMGQRGKIVSLWEDLDYNDFDFGYAEIMLDNETKSRVFWMDFFMDEGEYDKGGE